MLNDCMKDIANAGPPALSTQEKIEKLIREVKDYVDYNINFSDGITVLCKPCFYRKLLTRLHFDQKRQWREMRNKFRQDKAQWVNWEESRGDF